MHSTSLPTFLHRMSNRAVLPYRNRHFFLLFLNLIISNTSIAQNLALHKPYTLSTAPNYRYTAPPSDNKALTDGIYTKGYFWSKTTTVGWQRLPVTITIDLGAVQSIHSVTFNTVRREDQNVYLPKNIFVFISDDDNNYKYAGDAADNSGNVPGPYLIKKFVLDSINTSGRYVRLAVVPNGTMIFCDEIEVLKGNYLASRENKLIPKYQLQHVEDSLQRKEFRRQYLKNAIDKIQRATVDSGIENKKYVGLKKQLNNKNLTDRELDNIKKEIGIVYAMSTKRIATSPYLVQPFNPWDTLNQFYRPKNLKGTLQYKFYLPVSDVEYGSFLLTNNSTTSKEFSFQISSNSASDKFELFDVPFVPSINYSQVPDPLVAINRKVSIEPGNTEMFIFRITGLVEGLCKTRILVNSENKEKTINILAQVLNFKHQQTMPNLNANVWVYFTRPMLKDRKAEVERDLTEHHVNTIVIPPSVLPNFGTTNYAGFGEYLSNLKQVTNLLLSMGYESNALKSGTRNFVFLSPEWKNQFIIWYNKITSYIMQKFPDIHIFLYPYDEVYGTNITDFKNLIEWAKGAIPLIKFYGTLTIDPAIDTLLPLVDVAQIQSGYKRLENLPPHNCEVWTYSGSAPSRALSPYSFYRLMSWKAFEKDYKGIGFWNYASEGIGKQLNFISDPLIYPSTSFSVIYDGPDQQIISTRRWEAFRLGIEDYSILQMYAKKVGERKAKALAKEVLTKPTDLNKADSVRNLILSEL